MLYKGHAVYEALNGLGVQEADFVVKDLTDAETLALLARDNALSDMSTNDPVKLKAISVELVEMNVPIQRMGYTLKEITSMQPRKEVVEDEPPAVSEEKPVTKTGDLWTLGNHRLLCGDSTRKEDVERVMGGEKAVLMATDPPYGCNVGNSGFTSQRDNIDAIDADEFEGREMQDFLELVFSAVVPSLTDNCAWYLWHAHLLQGYFAAAAAAAAAGVIIHRQIIWKKDMFIFGRGDYHQRHEPCFYGWRKGNRPEFYGERNQDTVWEVDRKVKRSEVGHPTAKPIELFAIPMRNHMVAGEVCCDPFLGSGSQLIAADQLDRICYGIEIAPKYCDVIIKRYINHVGSDEHVSVERKGKTMTWKQAQLPKVV
jgi:DNA modification methylase